MTTTTQNEVKYFNLHTTGLGYINRIRDVKPKNGKPFLACTIGALSGSSESVSYVYYDVRVAGETAQELVRRCEEAVNAKQKVLIGFRIGDAYPDVFTYESGKKEGEIGVNMKGRLLFISRIMVDGVVEYVAESKKEGDDSENAANNQAEANMATEGSTSEMPQAEPEKLAA